MPVTIIDKNLNGSALGDNPLEAQADGSGIGVKDDDDVGSGDGDKRDPGDCPPDKSQSSSGTGGTCRVPLPDWLMDIFYMHVEACKKRDAKGWPLLYLLHETFWFPKPLTWFLLKQTNISPELLHNPQFFLWDPIVVFLLIPCPNCKSPLQRHAHIPRPRQCVSFTETFWMIGYRYQCAACSSKKDAGKNTMFCSWDPQILAALPPALASKFPAQLSHCSAIDSQLLEWMRSCFQNGVGSKQFSDMLRVQHVLCYNKLQLQYMQHLSTRHLDKWMKTSHLAFLPFNDRSSNGFHGYTPSGQWVRDMYDKYIHLRRQFFHQHMSLLSAEINAIDHSFKVCLTHHIQLNSNTHPEQFPIQIIHVSGEQVFSVLLTVTNKRGKIRVCCLVATKAHLQFESALQEVAQSLKKFGLRQPVVFYTNTMTD